jgi:hypothetical protein
MSFPNSRSNATVFFLSDAVKLAKCRSVTTLSRTTSVGFDEMKHGMTLARFESMMVELMRLDRAKAKIVILGRATAFHDEYEFRSIILGRQRTGGGQDVAAAERRAFRDVTVRDFTIAEARTFVERYFPIAAADAFRGTATGIFLGGSVDLRPLRSSPTFTRKGPR